MKSFYIIFTCISVALMIAACGSENKATIIGNYCAIDSVEASEKISNTITIGDEKKTKVNGWIADVAGNLAPEKLEIILIDSGGTAIYREDSEINIKRPDLESVFKKNNILNSGFKANINLNNLEKGDYSIQLLGKFKKQNLICNPNINIIIR